MLLPRIYVIYYREDDPRKNTSIKMVRYGYAILVHAKRIRGNPVVLNPYSKNYLGLWLKCYAEKYGVVVVDASWKKLDQNKFRGIKGIHVKLPPLLPGNPINYGKPCILSSIEAVAAALYILGFKNYYEKLLGLYKWMKTFNDLNKDMLEDYSRAKTVDELQQVITDYWGEKPPC
ncbi:MAG: DUF367 family protein [Thermoprotei archaeon]